jgi:hypothetical protein
LTRSFSDPALASPYDTPHPHTPGDAFYLPLLISSTAVLDIGYGIGTPLHRARDAGHPGRLCGPDLADAMLDQAREQRRRWLALPSQRTAFPTRAQAQRGVLRPGNAPVIVET